MPKKQKPKAKRRQTRIDKKRAFLKAYIASASLTAAAEAVGMDRSNHYDWLEKNPEYRTQFAAAELQAGQTLEDDAVHWARVGVFEPLVYQGRFQFAERPVVLCTLPDGREVREDQLPDDKTAIEIQSRRTVYEQYGPPLGIYRRSEGLMARLLKRFMPDRYAERGALELSGKNGEPIEHEHRVVFVAAVPKSE